MKRKCKNCKGNISAKLHFNVMYCCDHCKYVATLKMKRDAYNNNPDHKKRWSNMTDEHKKKRILQRIEWGKKNSEKKNETARDWYCYHKRREQRKIQMRRWVREFKEAKMTECLL